MRKITREVVNAFLDREPKSKGNTFTDGTALFLHKHMIARHDAIRGGIMITTAGWPTRTTKERLNAIPGVSVTTKDFQLHLNGKPWNGDWILAGSIPQDNCAESTSIVDRVEKMASELVREHLDSKWKIVMGIPELDPWLEMMYGENANKTGIFGQTQLDKFRIVVNDYLVKKYPIMAFWRILALHEIAHALVGVGHDHDETWRKMAEKIGCAGANAGLTPVQLRLIGKGDLAENKEKELAHV
jgi:hypothetical protein